MIRGLSTRRKSVLSVFEAVCVPGTVFTGDSDLCKMLLAHVPGKRTMRSGGWRSGFSVSQKSCRYWLGMRRTFGSLRHCVEADLFAMTDKSLGDVTDSRGLTISNADFVGGNCELVRLGGRTGATLRS
jgi:hypothetical protein